jgi:diguanylate cyclase (GGDEF)-like protein/PAS domain S-box-containing protein
MNEVASDQCRRLLDASPLGVVLIDALHPERPVLYANAAFLTLTAYATEEVLGRSLSFLQGDASDADRDARAQIDAQLARGEPCRAVLRHRRKDGTPYWCEVLVTPLRDEHGTVTHIAEYHRDAGDKLPAGAAAAAAPTPPQRDDRLTGLFTLPYLEQLLKRDWAIAQRERRSIAVFAIDIDALDLYNATFGRAAGDSMIRRVSHCVSGCLRRASDVVARADGGRLVAFAAGLTLEQGLRVGQTMTERVRDLRIHHPRSTVLRYVSVSVGVAAATPEAGDTAADLLQRSRQQLDVAKKTGRNHAA